MSKSVNDLVAYLAGEPGETADRCRRALADPASDLSLFLTSARERTRAAIAEPAFRGLGLSPAACLPADFEAPAESEPDERSDRHWLPWAVAGVAVLVAGLAIWGPWRSGPAPGPRADDPAPVGEPVAARPAPVDREAVPGLARPAGDGEKPADAPLGTDKPVAAAPKVEPGTPRPSITGPAPLEVPAVPKPAGPEVPAAKVAEVGRPATPVNPTVDERSKAVEQLGKRLEAAEARVAALERENDKLRAQAASLDRDSTALRNQVGTLNREAARAAQAHAACKTQAAAQEKVIDGLKAEAAKLQQQVRMLEAQLKVRPPIDAGPVKPKVGLPLPDLKVPVDPNKKKP